MTVKYAVTNGWHKMTNYLDFPHYLMNSCNNQSSFCYPETYIIKYTVLEFSEDKNNKMKAAEENQIFS